MNKSIFTVGIIIILTAIFINSNNTMEGLERRVANAPQTMGAFVNHKGKTIYSHVEARAHRVAMKVYYTISYTIDGVESNLVPFQADSLEKVRAHHKKVMGHFSINQISYEK